MQAYVNVIWQHHLWRYRDTTSKPYIDHVMQPLDIGIVASEKQWLISPICDFHVQYPPSHHPMPCYMSCLA